LPFIGSAQGGETIDKVVAVIGEETVLLSDIQGQMLELLQSNIQLTRDNECTLVENTLFQKLLVHQAEVDSVVVPDEQVEAQLSDRFAYYRNLLAQYNQTFESAYGKSESEWREEIRVLIKEKMMSDQMQATITQTVTITPREVEEFYNSIPEDSLWRINQQVEYAIIRVKPGVSALNNEVAVLRLTNARNEIINGESKWRDVCYLTDDPGTAKNACDFGCVERGMFVKEFDKMAATIEVGDVSEPFRTEYGWHIMTVTERKGTGYCGKHILIVPEITSEDKGRARDRLDSIRTAILDKSITFSQAASEFSQDENTATNGGVVMNFQTGSSMWDVADLDRSIAILINQMEVGQISAPTLVADERGNEFYQIVFLKKRTAPHVANLKDDYQFLYQMALNKKKSETITKWVQERIRKSYIWLSPDYQECEMTYNWNNINP
jgi:peptidyl-prolyl cis-trans isomerase SurA